MLLLVFLGSQTSVHSSSFHRNMCIPPPFCTTSTPKGDQQCVPFCPHTPRRANLELLLQKLLLEQHMLLLLLRGCLPICAAPTFSLCVYARAQCY